MKKIARKKCRKISLEANFFCIRENVFQSLRTKSLLYMICWTTKFLVVFLSIIIQNYDVQFALVLHLNCTALSQSESSIFSCVLFILLINHFSVTNLVFWRDGRAGQMKNLSQSPVQQYYTPKCLIIDLVFNVFLFQSCFACLLSPV